MKTELIEVNQCVRELDIRVEWDDLKDKFNTLVDKYHANYQRKGFRKGKFPKALFKKEMGPSIEIEFSDNAVNDYFSKALEEHHLNPVNQAKIDHFHFHEKSDLHFKARFEVIPDFELPDYKNKITITVNKMQITEKDILRAIENMRKQHAEVNTVDRPVEESDQILADFQEVDSEGHPIVGKKHENQLISIDRGVFREDDQKIFIGKSAGDTVRLSNNSTEDPIHFSITIKEVKEQILPELNNEFAEIVKPGVKTVEELKISVNTDFQEEIEHRFETECRDRIADYFVKNTHLDIPPSMKERYLDNIVEDVKKKAPPTEQIDEYQTREKYSALAENAIRWNLITEKLYETENLTVDSEDLKNRFEEIAARFNLPVEKIKAMYSKPDRFSKLNADILNDKLFDWLKSYTQIQEVIISADDADNKEKK